MWNGGYQYHHPPDTSHPRPNASRTTFGMWCAADLFFFPPRWMGPGDGFLRWPLNKKKQRWEIAKEVFGDLFQELLCFFLRSCGKRKSCKTMIGTYFNLGIVEFEHRVVWCSTVYIHKNGWMMGSPSMSVVCIWKDSAYYGWRRLCSCVK